MAFPEGPVRSAQLSSVEIQEHRARIHENFRKIAHLGVGPQKGAYAGRPDMDIGFEIDRAKLSP